MIRIKCPYCGYWLEIDVCKMIEGKKFTEECSKCGREVEIYVEKISYLSECRGIYYECKISIKEKSHYETDLYGMTILVKNEDSVTQKSTAATNKNIDLKRQFEQKFKENKEVEKWI